MNHKEMYPIDEDFRRAMVATLRASHRSAPERGGGQAAHRKSTSVATLIETIKANDVRPKRLFPGPVNRI